MVCGVGDLYLNSTFGVDVLFAAGPDRGPEKTGKVMVMVRDLYGLKSSGVSWRTMFAETFRNVDFVPMVPDPDVCRRWVRKSNGED